MSAIGLGHLSAQVGMAPESPVSNPWHTPAGQGSVLKEQSALNMKATAHLRKLRDKREKKTSEQEK